MLLPVLPRAFTSDLGALFIYRTFLLLKVTIFRMLRKNFKIPNALSALKCSEIKNNIYCSSIKTSNKEGLHFNKAIKKKKKAFLQGRKPKLAVRYHLIFYFMLLQRITNVQKKNIKIINTCK